MLLISPPHRPHCAAARSADLMKSPPASESLTSRSMMSLMRRSSGSDRPLPPSAPPAALEEDPDRDPDPNPDPAVFLHLSESARRSVSSAPPRTIAAECASVV